MARSQQGDGNPDHRSDRHGGRHHDAGTGRKDTRRARLVPCSRWRTRLGRLQHIDDRLREWVDRPAHGPRDRQQHEIGSPDDQADPAHCLHELGRSQIAGDRVGNDRERSARHGGDHERCADPASPPDVAKPTRQQRGKHDELHDSSVHETRTLPRNIH